MKTRSNTARTAEATPNLRERAERLRDAAGRFMRRKPTEAPLVAAEGPAAAADPILLAIGETERLTAVRNAAADLPMPEGRLDPLPEQDAAQDAFWAHVDNVLLKTVPTTAAGCTALARYAIDFLKRDSFVLDEHEGNEHVRILELIARSPLLNATVPRPVPAGDVDGAGFITYEDAGGRLHRRPIAQWIAFTAARLSSIAQFELTRQFNARYQGLSDEERGALEDELRRELRIDALHDLAFRSDQVFEVHKGHAVGHRWRVVGDDAVKPDQPILTPKASAECVKLSDLNVNGLSALYERAAAVRELWSGARCLPVAVAKEHPNGCLQATTIPREEFERLADLALDVVDRIVAILDAADGDPDMEPDADAEPSLAAPIGDASQIIWAKGSDCDGEASLFDG